MNTNRRIFFITVAAGGSVLATSAHSQAKADESDPQQVAGKGWCSAYAKKG
jgi:hypothetical protein